MPLKMKPKRDTKGSWSKTKLALNATTTSELDFYLQEAMVFRESKKFLVLSWLRTHSERFPTLSILPKTILMTPMTLIASKSAFSTLDWTSEAEFSATSKAE
jgi:hypothetical protein